MPAGSIIQYFPSPTPMKSKYIKLFFTITVLFSLCFSSCKKTPAKNLYQSKLPETVPQRIISLSPANTEILCALGAMDKIVARSEFCDYPPEVLKIPVAGSFDGKTVSFETLLSYNPDFVYITAHMHDNFIPLLSSKNIPYYVSTSNSVEEIAQEIVTIAGVLNQPELGKSLNDSILEIKQNCLAINASKKEQNKPFPKVYWEIWNPPYMSIGSLSFINEIVTLAGGINIFADVEQTYPIVSDEAIIAANPDIIVLPNHTTTTIDSIINRPQWSSINAVQNKKIYELNADIISRPGPRCVEAIKVLQELFNE